MGAKSVLLIGGFAMATLLYLVYLGATYEPPAGTTTIVMPPQAQPPVEAEPQSASPPPQSELSPAAVEPAVPESATTAEDDATVPTVDAEEIEVAIPDTGLDAEPEVTSGPSGPATVELPALGNSDSFLTERLRQLDNGVALLSHLADEQLIRRFTVLVENIGQENLPQSNLPYREVDGEFPVRTIDDNLFAMDEAGYRRFDQAVDALVAMDVEQIVGLYRLASPLFQQAYAELGLGDASFDLALRRAIRTVLSTDELDGTPRLVKPSVMYLYADSQLEAMSAIQKQMIRIGPENQEKVKSKLREILQAL